MYPIFCEKCIQGPKIFREVSHIYENGQENTKFGGGSKSEIFSPFERQVGANVGPKKARINMIGSSGSGQPPQGPPPSQSQPAMKFQLNSSIGFVISAGEIGTKQIWKGPIG